MYVRETESEAAIVRAWAGRAKHVLFFSDADDMVPAFMKRS
jgi:hypothetical protein